MAVQKPVLGNASHLNGRPVADAAPTNGQPLVWNTSDGCYEPGTVAATTLAATATVALALTGAQQDAVSAALVNGVIPVASRSIFITKGSAAALTLAAPTVTTDDGKLIRVFATTAFAHTVTTPASKINGSLHLATFANVGDGITFEAYQGVWYVDPASTTVVIS